MEYPGRLTTCAGGFPEQTVSTRVDPRPPRCVHVPILAPDHEPVDLLDADIRLCPGLWTGYGRAAALSVSRPQ